MRKIVIMFCVAAVFMFSACTLTGGSQTSSSSSTGRTGSFLKSSDGGRNWENKIRISGGANIGLVDVLSLEVDPNDGNVAYIGTEKSGLFVTRDGAENWEKLVFPLTRIYGLAIDSGNSNVIYASGVLNKRTKIFKSLDGGKVWTEIYTEPSGSSVISFLKISRKNPDVLYSGTSEGMIFKTEDGGRNWKNLTKARGAVTAIAFDTGRDEVVYFGISGNSLLRTMDGGARIDDLGKANFGKLAGGGTFSKKTYAVVPDPTESGSLYVGTDKGIFKGSNFGDRWEAMNILESSKKFPIRAIAVNPDNNNEIIYSSGQAVYMSSDRGTSWLTFQLNTDKAAQVIRYDPVNSGNVYAGLRKI